MNRTVCRRENTLISIPCIRTCFIFSELPVVLIYSECVRGYLSLCLCPFSDAVIRKQSGELANSSNDCELIQWVCINAHKQLSVYASFLLAAYKSYAHTFTQSLLIEESGKTTIVGRVMCIFCAVLYYCSDWNLVRRIILK